MAFKKMGAVAVMIAAVAFCAVEAASANTISLELRPALQSVPVGATVNIGLYAVSDEPNDIPLSVMDVILDWDNGFLNLTGNTDDGPYLWLSSGFPAVGDSGLNASFTDGDAFYNAQSQLGDSALATAPGLLVTTFQFLALAETPGTVVDIPALLGGAETIVIDGTPGLDIHGALGSATVEIVPEPASISLVLLALPTALIRRRR